ncbi:MAG: sterol desaturase family protein [Pseudomonadales bacterium]
MIDLLSYVSLGFVPAFLLLALVHEARVYEKPRWWRTKMTVATVLLVGASIAVSTFWGTLLGDFHLLDGSGLGTGLGALVGIVVYEFFHYVYHRAAHRFNWLWRLGHQMHHSVEAMDAFGANYGHPIDLFMFVTFGSLVFYPLLGLTVEAGAVGGVWLAFNNMFQHANVHTPHWLGYLIQRPESHVVHHARGRHRGNYANLPLWDMLFGTFHNPRDVDGIEAGFYTGASDRVMDMLLFRDVSEAPVSAEPAPAQVKAFVGVDRAA